MSEQLENHKFAKFVDDRQQVWDASSLDSLDSCPRLYKLGSVDGWRPVKEGTATVWGKAVHEGFEVLDTYRFEGKTKEEAVLAACKNILENRGEELKASDDNKKNLETALRAIVWRADEFYYTDNFRVAELPDGGPALEVRFECPLNDEGDRISGRIDKIVWVNDSMYIVDTKTTASNLSDYYFNMYAPNTQVYAYLWATRHVLGLPVKGFIIDAVQTGVNFTRFGRAQFDVRESQLEEWRKNVAVTLEQQSSYHDNDYWPQNFSACGKYGGCKFRDICRQALEHRQAFFDADYMIKPYGTREYTDGRDS